jgi:hypothetical protein
VADHVFEHRGDLGRLPLRQPLVALASWERWTTTQWDAPGLGEWTVRELVAHTDRAYRTVHRLR